MAKQAKFAHPFHPANRVEGVFARVLSRLVGTARFVVDASTSRRRLYNKASLVLLCSVLGLAGTTAWAATPAGSTLTNNVVANYRIGGTAFSENASVSVVTEAGIQFMAATPGGIATPVGASQCAASGSTSGPFDLSGAIAAGTATLSPATLYGRGQIVYVQVTDQAKNLNAALVEMVGVTITAATTPNDHETLLLTETGVNTGVFVGAIRSVGLPPTDNNCELSASINTQISATYQRDTASSTVSAGALVDPYGVVFDSANGLPVDGARVTLVDASSGQSARVLCDDGSQYAPNPVITGSTFAACGSTVALPSGMYRFPLVYPGNYVLQVEPPAGYRFASTVPPASLPPGFAVVGVPGNGASYGTAFVVNPGPAIHIDIPVDAASGDLQIAKAAGKSVVGEGEFVPYTLTIRNNDTSNPALAVQIADRLPPGFRYQAGSARLNGATLNNPAISADGRTLTFNLGTIAAGSTSALKYIAVVSAGAKAGVAENLAYATGAHTSNTARASVAVREDLMRSRAILMGRVIIGSCDERVDNDALGLQNARIVLEDGTYILTDQDGRWHADNIRSGTHVVQLDLDSLPADYEVVACEKNSRFAGRSYSQFVNVRGGSLWRADFHVQKKALRELHLTQHLSASRTGDRVQLKLNLRGDGPINQASTTLMLPAGSSLIADSARLDSAATNALEGGDGFLTLRLPAQQGTWSHTLDIELRAANQDALKLMAMTRFAASGQQGITLPRAEVVLEGQPVAIENAARIPPPLPHHETPNVPGAQDRGQRTVQINSDATPQPVGADDRTRLVEQLPYDPEWLASAQPGTEWLHPQESFLPALPAIKAAVKLAPKQRAVLKLNGEEVSPLLYDGTEINATNTVALATWRGIHIKDGNNQLELVVTDESGAEVLRQSRTIHYSVSPSRVELVPSHSRLIADGKTRPILAVRFYDKFGYKMRRGVNGEFQLNSPYLSANQLEAIQRDPLAAKINNRPRYEVGQDGIALIELEPTTQSGEAILNFNFNEGSRQELRTWLEAGQRDWILVGFAEGTLGHKKLSGNMQALKDADADENLFDGNRIAFYAKGSIRGDYLLTMAYDTAKKNGDAGSFANLRQAIDPNRFYTLYADATQPAFDAASDSKLYLKIERRQFYAMFGDYDTGLSVTEFSRYSRTLTGLKSEYRGDKFAYNAFASQTAQAYIKDEIPGNGTSGLYRLSRSKIIGNSDKIRIEARDRFRSQVIVSSQTLTRYLDYDIDYLQGTLFFKSPVPVRDAAFNPVYIVAEYESESDADKKLTAGGRAAFMPNARTEIGATLVSEGNVGASGKLGGVDFTYLLSDQTQIKAEVARSDRELSNLKLDGKAWKVEALHQGEKLNALAYIREQEAGFGFGQQSNNEIGTRKYGAEVQLKLSDTLQIQGQAYRQDNNLAVTSSRRDLVEAVANQRFDKLTTYYGGRFVRDVDAYGVSRDSKQGVAGMSYEMPDKKLVLRAATEIAFGKAESVDFPDRVLLGADYSLTEQSKLFAEQEFARGEKFTSNMTRVGLRVQPWTGGEVAASLGNQASLDSGRIYANLGLVQRWQINEFWQTDFAIDRAQTLRNTGAQPLNPNVPLTSVSMTGDYLAVSLGANYNDSVWGANSRLEWREGDDNDRVNFLLGFQRNLDAGRVLAAGFSYTDTQSATDQSRLFEARLSYAHRPWDSEWVWLDRLEYIDELVSSPTESNHARKLINNFNANWMPNRHTQIALQYGAKYVFDTLDGNSYSGYTDLIGAEIRRDLGRDWDIGAHASMLHTWDSGVKDYGLGASVGYNLMENMWLAVGYNFVGFDDDDFSGSEYRVQGPYVAIRMKVDQDTLKLNDRDNSLFTRTKPGSETP